VRLVRRGEAVKCIYRFEAHEDGMGAAASPIMTSFWVQCIVYSAFNIVCTAHKAKLCAGSVVRVLHLRPRC